MCDTDFERYPELSVDYLYVNEDAESFDELPSPVQEDLAAWLNREPDEDDKARLLELYTQGKFQAWDCPGCSTRVYRGDPDSYDHFQGVNNQDFSFFGNREKYTAQYIKSLCDSCRFTS